MMSVICIVPQKILKHLVTMIFNSAKKATHKIYFKSLANYWNYAKKLRYIQTLLNHVFCMLQNLNLTLPIQNYSRDTRKNL